VAKVEKVQVFEDSDDFDSENSMDYFAKLLQET
jgi:hypothetical protein